MNSNKRQLSFGLTLILCSFLVFFSACGANENTPQAQNETSPETSSGPVAEVSQAGNQEVQPQADQSQMSAEDMQEAIQLLWAESAHAAAYVADDANENNRCAQCHSPINWQPTLDDLPESCFSCKFELEDPEPYITEADWQNIPCIVCHQVGRKDKVDPAYKWLEIAQIEQYASVGSTTELCQKCHLEQGFYGHGSIQELGIHQGMDCTACHDSHSTQASCLSSGCHDGAMDSGAPGHTEEHANLTCAACHDASGMSLGFREDDGVFSTLAIVSTAEVESTFFFYSHNIQLASACDQCHFAGNPYGISESESP